MGLTTDHDEARKSGIRPDGMQEKYVVLSDEERAKGFVRPVRARYTHVKCGGATVMAGAIAETYARDPKFYGGTYCASCRTHFPLRDGDQPAFLWDDGTGVGE